MFGLFNRTQKQTLTVGTHVILDDGRTGIIDSICASPYYGDSAIAAYVIGEGFAAYLAI